MSFVMVGAAVAVVSVGISAYSAASQASAQKDAAQYQAAVDRNNAVIAARQRSMALQDGEVSAQQAMQEQAMMLSNQRVAMAANGLDLTQGTPQDILASTRFLGAADVNTIQANAARAAWGYEVQESNATAGAMFAQWQANNNSPAAAGALAGTQSLLSSAASFKGLSGQSSGGASKYGVVKTTFSRL